MGTCAKSQYLLAADTIDIYDLITGDCWEYDVTLNNAFLSLDQELLRFYSV